MSGVSYPSELHYNEAHDWARLEGDTATLGITSYAQDALGEVVYFSPAVVGATISQGGEYGELESTKAVSTLISPLSGEVIEVNALIEGNESVINDDPYADGWLIKIHVADHSEFETLMDADAYRSYVDAL